MDIQYLKNLRLIAKAYNKVLWRLVDDAAKVIPFDLASDYIYEVIDLDRVKQELVKGTGVE